MKNKNGLKIVLSIFSLGIMFIGIYQFAFTSTFGGGTFFQPEQSTKLNSSSSSVQTAPNSVQTSSITNEEITFTADELAQYNGMNGNPAYVAVDGIVYDMTQLGSWKNGKHQGLSAGQDLTAALAESPHIKNILDKSPIVGKLTTTKKTVTVVNSTTNSNTNNNNTNSLSSSNPEIITIAQTVPVTTSVTPPQSWTLEALSKFNGMNGNPAYIAVNGTIYDVTNLGAWTNGVHRGIHAGQDITSFFASSPHSASILKQLPIIGQIGETIRTTKTVQNSVATTTATIANANKNTLSRTGDHDDDYNDDEDEYDDDEYDDHDDDDEDDDEHEDGDD